MQRIIDLLNWLADQDWGWWPLLKLRPPKEKEMTNIMLLKLTTFFGTLSGLIIALIWGHLQQMDNLIIDILIGLVAFFVIYRATFFPAWNSRARKKSGENA